MQILQVQAGLHYAGHFAADRHRLVLNLGFIILLDLHGQHLVTVDPCFTNLPVNKVL